MKSRLHLSRSVFREPLFRAEVNLAQSAPRFFSVAWLIIFLGLRAWPEGLFLRLPAFFFIHGRCRMSERSPWNEAVSPSEPSEASKLRTGCWRRSEDPGNWLRHHSLTHSFHQPHLLISLVFSRTIPRLYSRYRSWQQNGAKVFWRTLKKKKKKRSLRPRGSWQWRFTFKWRKEREAEKGE